MPAMFSWLVQVTVQVPREGLQSACHTHSRLSVPLCARHCSNHSSHIRPFRLPVRQLPVCLLSLRRRQQAHRQVTSLVRFLTSCGSRLGPWQFGYGCSPHTAPAIVSCNALPTVHAQLDSGLLPLVSGHKRPFSCSVRCSHRYLIPLPNVVSVWLKF